ncbi:MAG TPA: flagellar FlbD family protein [Candidatus Acidoferrales bacterium]|nr:flagellar FlbD family protein [Candidatus Acidoferrales bacterium]
MIALTRLNGHSVMVNSDLIESLEETPDTVVTLTTGAKLVVTESPDSVTAAVREWRVGILERALRRVGPQNAEARLRAVDNPAEN